MSREEDIKAFLDGELDESIAAGFDSSLSDEEQAMRADFAAISSALKSEVSPRPVGMERTLLALRPSPPSTWDSLRFFGLRIALAATMLVAISVPFWPYFSENRSGAVSSMSSAERDASFGSTEAQKSAAVPEASAKSAIDQALSNNATLENKKAGQPSPTTEIGGPKPEEPSANIKNAQVSERGGGFVSPEGMKPLPPIQGKIVPFSPGPPMPAAELANAPKHSDLVSRVKTLVRQSGGKLMEESTTKTASGKTTRIVSVTLDADEATRLVPLLRSTLGEFGSVSDVAEPKVNRFAGTANRSIEPTMSLEEIEKRLEELANRRTSLLKEFYEDAKPVKEVDAEIKELNSEKVRQTSNAQAAAPAADASQSRTAGSNTPGNSKRKVTLKVTIGGE